MFEHRSTKVIRGKKENGKSLLWYSRKSKRRNA
nr:MAG TPA: hypothetical protein [Caudoviricetes sp.]